jgi:hypothetical protein
MDPLDHLYDVLTDGLKKRKADRRGRRRDCVRCNRPFRDMRDKAPDNAKRVCSPCRAVAPSRPDGYVNHA